MMKKTLCLLLALLALFALAGCGSTSEKKAPVVLKASEVHPESYPTTQSTKYFGKLLEERSDGRIKLQVYPDGQLGGDSKVIDEAMENGVVDINRQGIDRYAAEVPMLQAFILPYVFRDAEHVWKVLDGPIGERMKNELKEKDKIVLAFYDSGMRSFYGKKPITSPADLAGMNLRVLSGDIFTTMLNLLQANNVSVGYNDIYPSLQIGKIDGAENNIPSYLSAKHYELASYYTLDEHMAIPEILFISKQTWDTLSPEDQKLLLECGAEAQAYERKAWAEFTKKGMDELKAKGVQFIQPDKTAFTQAMQPLYDKYPQLSSLIKEIQAVK